MSDPSATDLPPAAQRALAEAEARTEAAFFNLFDTIPRPVA